MAQAQAEKFLAEAIKAGSERDYARAVDILTTLIAGGDAPLDALLFLGRSYHALGEAGRAIASFRAYLREGGDAAAGNFFLGRAYLGAERYEEASQSLRKSLEAKPDHAQGWALLGASQLKLKRTKLALDCLERATSLAPDDARIFNGYLNALFVRACRLIRQGDPDMARQMLGFVIRNGHDGAAPRLWLARALRELGRNSEALAECEVAISYSPDDGSLRWLRAGLLLATGRQEEALAEFEELKALYPELPGLPQNEESLAGMRAAFAFRKGAWKEAAAQCLELLRKSPDNSSLRAMAAESFRELGQPEKAKAHWARAIAADPRAPDFHLGLALAHFELGEYAEALAQVGRARALGSDDGEIEYYDVLIESKMCEADGNAGGPGESLIGRIQEQLRRRGGDPRLMLALGEALYRSGRPDLAAGWFSKVLYLVPDHELSLLYLISIAESLADASALGPAYKDYLEAYPDNRSIRKEYVDFLFRSRLWHEAAKALEAGLAYGYSSPRHLALAYRNSGRYADAAIVYRDLLRENPESQECLLALALCLEKTGRADYALTLLEKAPESARRGAGPWIVMGLLNDRKGKTEAALDAFRKATDIEPANARAWKELGLAYRRLGLAEFAANSLERARALGASVEEAEPSGTIPLPRRPKARTTGAARPAPKHADGTGKKRAKK